MFYYMKPKRAFVIINELVTNSSLNSLGAQHSLSVLIAHIDSKLVIRIRISYKVAFIQPYLDTKNY